MASDWQLRVCGGCGAGDGAALLAALRRQAPELPVVESDCMSVCAAPVTLAAQGAGRATYVFSGITASDLDDIRAFGAAYLAAPAGWIEDARPLGQLRFRLVTRVPAMG